MRRVLIVTYHFPPMLSMAAVRMFRFVRHLGGDGWSPDILTADESRYGVRDSGMVQRLPDGVRLFRESLEALEHRTFQATGGGAFEWKRRVLKPGGFAKRSAEALRRWIPAAREPGSWRRHTLAVGRELVRANRYQLIYSTSGPLACHSVAAELADAGSLPWVAEFRDAVLDNPYLSTPTRWHRRHYSRLERDIVRQAARVVVTSRSHREALQKRYGRKLPVSVLPNGYDHSEYPERAGRDVSQFVMTYAGSLYGARSIVPFLQGWKAWLNRGACPTRIPWLHIYGESFNADLVDLVRDLELTGSVSLRGARSHADVMAAIASSDAVLVVKSPEDRIHIPGKLYEALGAGRPVLLLGQKSEASDLVERCDAGIVVSSLHPGAIADSLDQMAVRARRPLTPPVEFGIEALTKQLSDIFGEAADAQGAPGSRQTNFETTTRVSEHAH